MVSKKGSKEAARGLAIRRWNQGLVSSEKAEEFARFLRLWGWEQEEKKPKRVVGVGWKKPKRVVGVGW